MRPRRSRVPRPAVAAPPPAARPDRWGAGHAARDWLVTVVGLEVVALVAAVLVDQGSRWTVVLALPAVVGLLVLVAGVCADAASRSGSRPPWPTAGAGRGSRRLPVAASRRSTPWWTARS